MKKPRRYGKVVSVEDYLREFDSIQITDRSFYFEEEISNDKL
jgi:hypothetical protein